VAEDVSPTIARRRVRIAVREAREAAGHTQSEVAETMEWSLSKVIRIENGDVSISPNDLRPLLAFLAVKDRAAISELLALTKIARARQSEQWHQKPGVKEHLTAAMLRLVEYEAEAVEIRYYQVFHMPGPLQIPEYAQANLSIFSDGDIDETTRRLRAEARENRRQKVLSRLGDGLAVYALLDQSVFLRTLGMPAVVLKQLREMKELATTGKIQMRMIPFDFDGAVTNNATFDLLTIKSGKAEERSEVLYRETGLQDEIVEDNTVQRHRDRFDKTWEAAATEEDTIDFITGQIASLEAKIRDRENP
jgi:transcriptional regulator with XRE-family HTH domain